MDLWPVGLAVIGGLLVWTGLNDPAGGITQVVRDIVAGRPPKPGAQRPSVIPGILATGEPSGGKIGPGDDVWAFDPGGPPQKGVATNTAAAVALVKSRWGIKTVGILGPGSVPGSDHPRGKAADFMINTFPAAVGKAKGDAIAAFFVNNPNIFHTKYVIWNGRIAERAKGFKWAPYSGPSKHDDHVHVSFE